jgi:hypothetical protein
MKLDWQIVWIVEFLEKRMMHVKLQNFWRQKNLEAKG